MERHSTIDLEGMRHILSDHAGGTGAICSHPKGDVEQIDRSETVAAVAVDVVRGQIGVSAGLPCETPFLPVTFRPASG